MIRQLFIRENLKWKEVKMMKKIVFLTSMLIALFVFAGVSSAIIINSGPFGAKYSDVSFSDIDYDSVTGGALPFHPNQDPNSISGNIWGILSLTSIHTLLDNNPENNQLSGVAYYNPGSDGKYYFGVYGGLTALAGGVAPGEQRFGDAGGNYVKIYETTNPNLYDLSVLAGPNVPSAGAFGTFGRNVIYGADGNPGGGDDPTLWLDSVFSPLTLYLWYDGASDPPKNPAELELVTYSSSVTGSSEAYLDIIGGTGAMLFQTGVFPMVDPSLPFRADLKVISDLTADFRAGAWQGDWSTTSQDPITGVGFVPEPGTILLLGSGLLGLGAFSRRRSRK